MLPKCCGSCSFVMKRERGEAAPSRGLGCCLRVEALAGVTTLTGTLLASVTCAGAGVVHEGSQDACRAWDAPLISGLCSKAACKDDSMTALLREPRHHHSVHYV